ncbi:MAG: DinB family protein [Robiginitalea sp.]|uniref:DinB family protein n=1 Tax=Robiginitalea sp. TaxID=1902411 RepID=UPI003C7468D5
METLSQILVADFRDQAVLRISESLEKIQGCLVELDEEAFWCEPNKNSNSPATLLRHLQGNISQYITSGLGGAEDQRDREAEFTGKDLRNRKDVEADFFEVARKAADLIRTLPETALVQRKRVQGFELSGLGIILHVVEHLSYHTGQLVYLTKHLRDIDLGFYKGYDLNQKNG